MVRNERRKDTIGLLSPQEYKQWKKIFGVQYHKFISQGQSESKAKENAGKIAWTVMKGKGAQTKIDVLGSRDLLILRNTDKLYRSLLPGKKTLHSYKKFNKDQIYTVSKGKLQIGTSVEYANDVSEERPIWPDTMEPWINKATEEAIQTVTDKLVRIIR